MRLGNEKADKQGDDSPNRFYKKGINNNPTFVFQCFARFSNDMNVVLHCRSRFISIINRAISNRTRGITIPVMLKVKYKTEPNTLSVFSLAYP